MKYNIIIKTTVALLLLACITFTLEGQTKRTSFKDIYGLNELKKDKSSKKTNDSDAKAKANRSKNTINQKKNYNGSTHLISLPETVKNDKPEYYANFIRKDGWFEGVGKKLTLNEAQYHSCYYKFSHKNKAGKWTLVEAFDGYHKPTAPEDYGTYFLITTDEEDPEVNPIWKEKIKNVCKWAFHSDESGKTVVQELALDADSSIVFVFNLTKISEREYLGSYTDQWGLPVFIKDTELNDCASRVHITRDQDGRDVLIQYVDDKGLPQRNKDGVYAIKREYDKKDRITSELYLDLFGTRMAKNKGYCEWRSEFIDDSCEITMFYDTDGQPARIFKDINIIGGHTYYDEYGRDTTTVYIYGNGSPDDNDFNVHKICKKYNDHGQMISCKYLDENNNFSTTNDEELAQAIYDYDNLGRLMMQEFKDKDGNYAYDYDDTSDDFFSRKEIEYKSDEDNTIVHMIYYSPDDSDEKKLVKLFEFSKDDNGNETSKWYKWKTMKMVELFDSLQRPTLTAFYDLKDNPIDSLVQHITTYNDKYSAKIEQWVDCNGVPCYEKNRNYTKLVTITDSITDSNHHIIKEIRCQGDTIICAYEKIVDPKTGYIIQQNDLTEYDDVARVGWLDKLYYKCSINNSFNGKWRAYYGRNEFDEPSYIRTIGEKEEVFYIHEETGKPFFLRIPGENVEDEEEEEEDYYSSNDDLDRNYDENCDIISSYEMDDFIKELPRAFCIEVTDAARAYRLNLKNGDIIVSFGNWTASEDLKTNMNNFYLETILQANTSKRITLLRHHPDQKTSEIIFGELPRGRVSDLGFYPHMIYYTQKEHNRFIETCKDKVPLSHGEVKGDTTILLAVQKKGSPESTPYYYYDGNKDAGIILCAAIDDDVWSIRKTIPMDEETGEIQLRTDSIILTLTYDFYHLLRIPYQNSFYGGLEIIPLKVNKNLYEEFKYYYALNRDVLPNDHYLDLYRHQSNSAITDKKLRGKWCVNDLHYGPYDMNMTLILDKDNRAEIEFRLISETDEVKQEYTCRATPQWILNGVCLDLDFSNSKTEYELVKFEAQEVIKPLERTIIEQKAERFRQNLINDINNGHLFIENCLIIKDLSKDVMTVMDGNEELVFKKVK